MNQEQFKEWRKRQGITQKEAAERLGVTRLTIARYETVGKIPRSMELLTSMLDSLDSSSRTD